MNAPLRSAEKSRHTTCAFADDVANRILFDIRSDISSVPESVQPLIDGSKQTCIAGWVLLDVRRPQDRMPALDVIASAAGTKYGDHYSGLNDLRDGHAEVLSRRALKRVIALELARSINVELMSSKSLCWFERDPDTKAWTLSDGLSIHFYSSSCPCGNAAIKRFCNPKREKHLPSVTTQEGFHLPPQVRSYSLDDIKNYYPSAIKQGETAITYKIERPETEGRVDLEEWLPKGIDWKGSILSCSDKLMLCNILGLQGNHLLCCADLTPISMNTVSVGRKFSRPPLQRALVGRTFNALYRSKKRSRSAHRIEGMTVHANTPLHLAHPPLPDLYCTAVKADDGVYDGDGGALFAEGYLVSWREGKERRQEWGHPTIPSRESILSRKSFMSFCSSLGFTPIERLGFSTDSDGKCRSDEYQKVKRNLVEKLTHPSYS